jgi:excisionase family DNA binding protein
MRSLQDWMKYLEQQEQSVKETPAEPLLEQEITGPEITLDDVPYPPKADSPMVTSVTPVDDADPSATAVEEAVRIRKKPTPKPAVRPPKAVAKPRRETKESREQLLQRLLDPMVSLEEAAKLLEVCPTTVRRYTNKGLLKHYRTAGNQRRFKLSDILGFLESSGK